MKSYYWLLLLILVSSCSVLNDDEGTADVTFTGVWEVVEFFNTDGGKISMNEDEPLTLRFFNDDEFGGEADCNNFSGEYEAKRNGSLTVKILSSTEAACKQPSLGDDYLEALSNVSDFEQANRQLILSYGKEGRLSFLERLE